ncbi:MAG: hypothetical protein GWP14_09700 [Actinobacteria bacterium]|nr:hypothetical protein [Actinomycetota bacterium]
MSTPKHNSLLDVALKNIPKKFRTKIIDTYLALKRHCVESRSEAAGLSTGKFCETAIRYLQANILGAYTPFGKKIGNFPDECRKLITSSSGSATESERVIIPRALVYLYTMRNKRGIGHIGGDVDSNQIDTMVMVRVADWIVCELIRINHGLSLEEAQDIVDNVSVRQLPAIWEIDGKRRVLKEGLKANDQVLLLLYAVKETAVMVEDLCSWIEYSNLAVFKSRVLAPLHTKRLIEYNKEIDSAVLSPKGAKRVERDIL